MNREEARQLAHALVAQMTLDEKAAQLRYQFLLRKFKNMED